MKVQILNPKENFQPTDVAVSAARTCYFPNGIVKPEESTEWGRKDTLLKDLFESGHHTTLQHTHITLSIEGISRHLIWRLLHSHPYYNSEQISQRYAKMKQDAFVLPLKTSSFTSLQKIEEFYREAYNTYEELIDLLKTDIEKELPKFKKPNAKKFAQEIARYVLPVGTSAYLYHTINIVTALRYIAVAPSLPEVREEALEFTKQLEAELLKYDNKLSPLIESAKKTKSIFPKDKIDLISYKNFNNHNSEVKVISAISPIVDFDIGNINYAEVARPSQMFLDLGVTAGFTTQIALSLSADAQNQRHRRSPAFRPSIEDTYIRQNFYLPQPILNNKRAKILYIQLMTKSYDLYEELVKKIGFEEAVYVLTNAHKTEIIEYNDYASFHHKAQMRLCWNAQKEIFDIVYKQIEQLQNYGITDSIENKRIRKIASKFLPPCSVRNEHGIKPTCPEGARFCGTKVWKMNFKEMNDRKI